MIYKTSAPVEVNEFKKDLILWAQNQATGQRTSAAMCVRKHTADDHRAKAESYDFMVAYLQSVKIKPSTMSKQTLQSMDQAIAIAKAKGHN